jgi:glycerol-3-phosphate dehydrogenase (NAD(P)+)
MTAVAVLGAGAWGTALACAFARVRPDVRLWGRDAATMAAMATTRVTERLPGVVLPPGVRPTGDRAAAVAGAAIVVVAVPAQSLHDVLADGTLALEPGVPLVICAKGIERRTGRFLSEVVAACRPGHPVAILSGPSFAGDVGRGRPTAVTLAAAPLDLAARLGQDLGSGALRLYHTDDVRGVEIGGAAKNVLAIACGIAQGQGLGASAGAALIARAFAELSRFGRAFGGRPETLAGLSGLGDLVLTCGSAQSRNFAYGEALGRGVPHDPARGPVVEGVWTAAVLVDLAARADIDMPICRAVDEVIGARLDVRGAIERLMNRPLKAE